MAEEMRFPSRAANPRGRAIRPILPRRALGVSFSPDRPAGGPKYTRKSTVWVRAETTSHRAMPSTMVPTAFSAVSGARRHSRASTSRDRRTCSASSVMAAG